MPDARGHPVPRRGTTAAGMEYLTWGVGPKSLLYIPGGPGSALPRGVWARLSRRWFAPFVDAGYAIWYVTRRRSMPTGHSIADMADDYASVVAEHLDGRADVVVGESFGGMVAQYLAANHGEAVDHVAVVVAAAEVSDWGKDVDRRLVSALARKDSAAVGMAFAEYGLPGERARWVRRLVGPWIGRSLTSGKSYPAQDLLVETEAELAFDARPVLSRIEAPVVLVCGDRDRFFPWDVVDETARLIPSCALVRYEGQGHMKVASSKRVPHDVLAYVNRS